MEAIMKTPSKHQLLSLCFAFLLILCFSLPLNAEDISHIGTDQRVLVACVKYSDIPTTRIANCRDWADLLQTEVNTYYNQSTFNQTDFIFSSPSGGPADGWYSLSYDYSEYSFTKTGQDVIDLVDPDVDFSNFDRMIIIFNRTICCGQTGGTKWWRTDEGGEREFVEDGRSVWKRYMTLSVVHEWGDRIATAFDDAGSVAAHELGHQLGLKTHYKSLRWFPGDTRRAITPWDLMGLSPTLNHFLGWAKYERGWIPSTRVETVLPPSGADRDVTITLHPLETAGGTQLIEIPIVLGPPFFGYYVENRRQINGDENLPSSGVLITLVDRNPNTIVKTIVLDDPTFPGDIREAALELPDSYYDATNNIRITYMSHIGDNAGVRVQYNLPPEEKPNPSITPWGAPPWNTSDIWIDSQRNGWGNYRYVDSSGEPEGNGDDAWVGHDNRVYVRVTNNGPGIARNVRVQVYQNSPPGMGDSGADWDHLGTIFFPTLPSTAVLEDYVIWSPEVGEHTCLKAVILDTPGELHTGDNVAQENVTAFDTASGSPYEPVGLKIRVNNPFVKMKTPVTFHIRDIPEGWAVLVDPQEMLLPEGGFDFVTFKVFPSGYDRDVKDRDRMDERNQPGFIGKPKIEALVPYADTVIPIGGVDLWAHLVEATTLTCDIEGQGHYRDSTIQKEPFDSFEQYKRIFENGALIRAELPPVSIARGESIVVKGRLTPAIPDSVIAVEFTHTEKRVIRFTKTSESGEYTAYLKAPSPGIWQVQASYDGNMTYGKSKSNYCRYEVKGD
jgi:M6 family metalloprotease-like protein